MLKQIFSKELKKQKIHLEPKRILSSDKTKEIKINKDTFFTFKSSNSPSNTKEIIINEKNNPLLEGKINIVMNRPDYSTPQNKEFKLPPRSINKKIRLTKETTKNKKIPKNEKLIHNLNNEPNIILNNNKGQKQFTNINLNEKNINNKKDIKNDEIQIDLSDSKSKTKPETAKSYELNLSNLSDEGIEKIKLLDEYITQIKKYSSNINESKIQKCQKQKNDLENEIYILSNNIKLYKKKYNDNLKLKKNFELEKEKIQYYSNKANNDELNLKKELQNNKIEIELMKNQITQIKEETKGINNYTSDIERQTIDIKEEYKKLNIKITNTIKEKDKITNEINIIQKKCISLRSKIDKSEKSAKEFLFNVEELLKLAKENFN